MKTLIIAFLLALAAPADNAMITWPDDMADVIAVDLEPVVMVEFGLIFVIEPEMTWRVN
jgi:hypothetical protein